MRLSPEFAIAFGRQLEQVRRHVGDRPIRADLCWDVEDPWPGNAVHFQCAFAAEHLRVARPAAVLDVASLREFVLGIQVGVPVVTVDIRPAQPRLPGEAYIVADASHLPFASDTFDAVVSLSALEHFGLGRYGDRFNLIGDVEAAAEMYRVLRPGGTLVVTAVVGAVPAIVFNAHRVYGCDQIRDMFGALELRDERLMSRRLGRYCEPYELTSDPDDWDFYLGCWRKTALGTANRTGRK